MWLHDEYRSAQAYEVSHHRRDEIGILRRETFVLYGTFAEVLGKKGIGIVR